MVYIIWSQNGTAAGISCSTTESSAAYPPQVHLDRILVFLKHPGQLRGYNLKRWPTILKAVIAGVHEYTYAWV